MEQIVNIIERDTKFGNPKFGAISPMFGGQCTLRKKNFPNIKLSNLQRCTYLLKEDISRD